MAKAEDKPDRLTLFLANRDPDNPIYVKMMRQTGIPTTIIPAADGPMLWLRYEDKRAYQPACYGPTAVKYCLERLAEEDG